MSRKYRISLSMEDTEHEQFLHLNVLRDSNIYNNMEKNHNTNSFIVFNPHLTVSNVTTSWPIKQNTLHMGQMCDLQTTSWKTLRKKPLGGSRREWQESIITKDVYLMHDHADWIVFHGGLFLTRWRTIVLNKSHITYWLSPINFRRILIHAKFDCFSPMFLHYITNKHTGHTKFYYIVRSKKKGFA
jgi:hypothetical protein